MAAEQGNNDALTFLVELEPDFHFTGLRARAQKGQADAQYSLGNRYARGEGVAQDDAEAVRWYRLAAEQRQECTFQIELREMGIWSHS